MAGRVGVVGWSEKTQRCVELEIDADRIRRELPGFVASTPGEIVSKGYRAWIPIKDPSVPANGRWAAVVLDGDREEARRALEPLIRAREQVAWGAGGRGLLVMERPDTDTNTERWIKRLREAAGDAAPPHNLLLVGGPDRFPFDVQHALDQVFRTGRLDAGGPDGKIDWSACAAYAQKVARYESGAIAVSPQAVLYSFASDGPTREAHAGLSTPLCDYLRGTAGREQWKIATHAPRQLFEDAATTTALLQTLADTCPALVFTVSHGIEEPADPARWGALTDVSCLGSAGSVLSAASLPTSRFAEGAVFFSFACFSAGVPVSSIFSPPAADGTRPVIGGGPMTAPLARALLAHPAGPIAFVGHVDRVTNLCFNDGIFGRGLQPFLDFLDWTLGGFGTLGQAMSTFHELGTKTLTGLVRHASPLARRRQRPNDTDVLTDLWQRYYDYSGFLLLGDPVIELRAKTAAGD
jgi:hypothetical protein